MSQDPLNNPLQLLHSLILAIKQKSKFPVFSYYQHISVQKMEPEQVSLKY